MSISQSFKKKNELAQCVFQVKYDLNVTVTVKSRITKLYSYQITLYTCSTNCISDVMVSMVASNAVDHGFNPSAGQPKYYEIDICCFSPMYAALRRKKEQRLKMLARNRDNMSEWSNMSTCRLLFQLDSTIKIQLSVLIQY